jgi:hypothetical protein
MAKSNDLIKVFYGPEGTVILLKSRLEEEGITSLIKNDSSEAFLGVSTPFTDLYINESDLDKALPLIAEIKKSI